MNSVSMQGASRPRLCRALAAMAGVLSIGLVLANAVMWLAPSLAQYPAHAMPALGSHPIALDLPARLMAMAASSAGFVALAMALWSARRLFLRFASGAVFEAGTGVLLRRVGILLVVYAGLTPIIRTLVTTVVTLHNPPGGQVFAISLSSDEMLLALIGALIVMIGAVMADAARLADDNREIV